MKFKISVTEGPVSGIKPILSGVISMKTESLPGVEKICSRANSGRSHFLAVFLLGIIFTSSAQTNVTFFGSSVCKGSGSTNDHGYAWLFFNGGSVDTALFRYYNASTGGDNTLKIEKEDRITRMLYPTNPQIVVIGLSLANEGILSQKDDNQREQIFEQFRSRLIAMADSLTSQGIKPVIVNCYGNNNYTKVQYSYIKRMNRVINTWKYPSINVLGAVDNGEGKWVAGYYSDPGHPNNEGHAEMSYTIVPSMFEAIMTGKKVPRFDWNKSYSALINKDKVENPLFLDVKNIMHSFTLSLRFKDAEDGSIAGFVSDSEENKIIICEDTIRYRDISATFPRHLKDWTHLVLAHSYANQKTMLYLNGDLIGITKEQSVPARIYFGGTSSRIELKDIMLHRSCLNEDEALDLYNKKFIQSSLEFFNPLTKPISGNRIENIAQSLSEISVESNVKLENIFVPLY